RFAGLNHRLQGQVGYQRHFFREKEHRFWGELGYDLTVDEVYQQNDITDPTMMDQVIGMTETLLWVDPVHSVRLFVGYENKLNQAVTFMTGLEALLNVQDSDDTRINWKSTLISKLAGSLNVELGFLLVFDNQPPPMINQKLDTVTTVNLVYAFL
ncbi:MAG: DUF481 domain-containing protein, partial [Myxococcales bacterium]|nr:DUF481 domain-containing protein [Myxococcales bacterium]